jgi:hypothetical protein
MWGIKQSDLIRSGPWSVDGGEYAYSAGGGRLRHGYPAHWWYGVSISTCIEEPLPYEPPPTTLKVKVVVSKDDQTICHLPDLQQIISD